MCDCNSGEKKEKKKKEEVWVGCDLIWFFFGFFFSCYFCVIDLMFYVIDWMFLIG